MCSLKPIMLIDGDPTDKAWEKALRYVNKPLYHTTSRWAPKEVEGKTDFISPTTTAQFMFLS